MGCQISQVLLLCHVSHCSEGRSNYMVVRGYTGTLCAFSCNPTVWIAKTGMIMCARTCLFLWLLITPLELLPPAGQVPLRLNGLALGGLRRFGPASDGLRSCRTAGSHGRGRVVWRNALCGGRLQHQVLRCGVSTTKVYARKLEAAMQGGAAETVVVRRAIPAGCSARVDDASSQLQAFVWASGSAWRCTALLQRCGQQAVW
jgi:hypothetical protein